MSPQQNTAVQAKLPAPRKRGGKLSGIRSHQGSAKRHIVPLWEEALA